MTRARRQRVDLPAGTSPLVAVVVDPDLPYEREIAKGVALYAREVGDWRLYVEEEQARRLPDFTTWSGHGIIASFDEPHMAEAVVAARLPIVAVGGGGGAYDPASGIAYVATDNEAIACIAADHLLERALQHFGYYGLAPSPATVWSAARGRAFERRISIARKPCSMLVARHDSTRWSLLQAELAAWLTSLPKPVGIMACDDVRARHVLEACRSLGLRVPHEVAVIGVDDDAFVCELSDPPLSSVAQAARRIGHEAAGLLDRLMRPDQTPERRQRRVPARTIVPPLGVVARRSTDTLAVEDPTVARVIRMIRERACGPIATAELVAASGLSRWQVADRFRRLVGRSIRDEILHVRHKVGAPRQGASRDAFLEPYRPRLVGLHHPRR